MALSALYTVAEEEKTNCRKGYVTQDCKNAPKAKSTATTGAQPVQPAALVAQLRDQVRHRPVPSRGQARPGDPHRQRQTATESDDVGRSLAQDRKRHSDTKPKKGEGDKGDR